MFLKMVGHISSPLAGPLIKKFRKIMGSSRGFTLIEALVSISIMVIVTGIFGAAMFQVFGIQRYWTDDIKATRTTRHAASWFAGDALNASAVLDAGGDALPCPSDVSEEEVILEWTNASNKIISVRYLLTGEVLTREQAVDGTWNGVLLRMTDGVKTGTLGFTLCENLLRATMDVASDRDNVESLDLITFVRKLP